MTNQVINVSKSPVPETGFLYVGRLNKWKGFTDSKWRNPFWMADETKRKDVLHKFLKYIMRQPHLLNALHELDGLTLGCWCHPKKCHAHILIKLRELQKTVGLSDVSSIERWIEET